MCARRRTDASSSTSAPTSRDDFDSALRASSPGPASTFATPRRSTTGAVHRQPAHRPRPRHHRDWQHGLRTSNHSSRSTASATPRSPVIPVRPARSRRPFEPWWSPATSARSEPSSAPRADEPIARQRPADDPRQHRRRPDRLPTARRAARVDGRHATHRTGHQSHLRRRIVLRSVAARRPRRAIGVRCVPGRRAEGGRRGRRCTGMGRCGDPRSLGRAPSRCRPRPTRSPLPGDGCVHGLDRRRQPGPDPATWAAPQLRRLAGPRGRPSKGCSPRRTGHWMRSSWHGWRRTSAATQGAGSTSPNDFARRSPTNSSVGLRRARSSAKRHWRWPWRSTSCRTSNASSGRDGSSRPSSRTVVH